MPAGTRYHAPQVGLSEIATQTQPPLGNLSQRQVHSDPATRRQVFRQIAHHTRMWSAQAQALALGGKATVFGHGFGQALLENTAVGRSGSATRLAAQLQL